MYHVREGSRSSNAIIQTNEDMHDWDISQHIGPSY